MSTNIMVLCISDSDSGLNEGIVLAAVTLVEFRKGIMEAIAFFLKVE
jgi:hypothetical protein